MNISRQLWQEYCRAHSTYQTVRTEANNRIMLGAFEAWRSSFLGTGRAN